MTIDLCIDCHLAAQGYDPHELGYTPLVEPLRLIEYPLLLVPNVDMGSDVSTWGDGHFSSYPCAGCGSTLAGQRLEYIVIEQCSHGMSASLCMGPQHYPSRQDEMSGRYYP